MAGAITTRDILDTLDAAAEDYDFPDFDHPEIDYISSRLEVYGDERNWALVFNSIGWNDTRFCTMIEAYGNCVVDPTKAEPRRAEMHAAGTKLFGDLMQDLTGGGRTDPADIEALVRAANETTPAERLVKKAKYDQALEEIWTRHALDSDPTLIMPAEIDVDYRADNTQHLRSISVRGRKIPLESLAIPAGRDRADDPAFWASVALMKDHRESLLATATEVRALFPGGMPPRLLALDDWRHIDVEGAEMPSETETFRMLAEVIVHRDAARYQPGGAPNTHWSRWLNA
jgi:hypothetical protein